MYASGILWRETPKPTERLGDFIRNGPQIHDQLIRMKSATHSRQMALRFFDRLDHTLQQGGFDILFFSAQRPVTAQFHINADFFPLTG